MNYNYRTIKNDREFKSRYKKELKLIKKEGLEHNSHTMYKFLLNYYLNYKHLWYKDYIIWKLTRYEN